MYKHKSGYKICIKLYTLYTISTDTLTDAISSSMNMFLYSKRITSFINLEKLWLKNNFHLDKKCAIWNKKKWQQSHKEPYALVYKVMVINSYFEYIMTTFEQMYQMGIKFNKKKTTSRVEVIFKLYQRS